MDPNSHQNTRNVQQFQPSNYEPNEYTPPSHDKGDNAYYRKFVDESPPPTEPQADLFDDNW